ncbi:MAG TPA: transglycosylase domain-containing protein [Solirubrobacterales bacterium]|nr:transglycosylase domain-containing protein [Solirubrobacterales bacterium]
MTDAPADASGDGGSVLRPPGEGSVLRPPGSKASKPSRAAKTARTKVRKPKAASKVKAPKAKADKVKSPRAAKAAPGAQAGKTGIRDRLRRGKAKGPEAAGDNGPIVLGSIPPAPGTGNGNGNPPLAMPSMPPAGKPPKPKVKKLRILFIVLGLGTLGLFSAFFGMFMAVSQDLPAIEKYAQYKESKNSIVTDSQGEVIGTLSSNQNRFLIPPDKISPNMKNAVVSIEDARFYEHRGVDYQGLGRALVQDIIARSAKQGASTITQQLIKQALEAQNDRSPLQKMKEMALAYHIEQEWTKDKILTEYLNTVYFGSGAYGVEAAARTYFGKAHPSCGTEESPCAEVLTPAEAALLAGVIQNPWGYDPANNPDGALFRRNTVLQKMLEQGYITQDQYDDATAEALPAASDIERPSLDSKAPYFTEYIRQQLVDRFGAGRTFFGGLKVKTTLDLEAQAATEEAISSTIGGIGPSASAVIINNADATIDAMVGGTDYKNVPFNLATQGYRQPGSTVKPFVLTTALEQGIPSTSVVNSTPRVFNIKVYDPKTKKMVKEPYEVNNYADSYLGPVSLETATINSDNAVYSTLGLEMIDGGPKAVAKTIRKMGVWDKVDTNAAMVLGTSEVTPLQWTYAYTTLANDGRRVSGSLAPDPGYTPVAYTKVTDEDGKTIKGGDNEVMSTSVIDPEVAQTVKGFLHGVMTSGTGTNADVGDDSEFGKTGTTDDNSNAWFCGAITEVTACVWVGYADSYQQMLTEYAGSPVDGGTFPAIIWSRIIEAWKEIEANRAAEREADAAAEADGEDTSSTDTSSDYVAPDTSTDYVAPETTTPAPAPTPTPEPTPTPAPTPEATPPPTTPAPPAGGGGGIAPGSGGAAPG